MNTSLMDHRRGYGLVSRVLHWGMALLVLWQAVSALLHYFADDTAVTDFFFGAHTTIGFLILVFAVLRGFWGLANLARRPEHSRPIDRLAAFGHLAMYLLLIAVPLIALIREYGSGEGFAVFGIQIFPSFQPEIEWTGDLGGALHGELGWVLFLLIAVHILMALVHEFVWKETRLARMTTGNS
ncbi:cytochrome b [Fodinicurvata halophila]|uniref:Cytochrome b n=1 Tax=Fodinicurvata halophila TaxID=1419723 RepID=A0ABV8UGZ0_9PROT